MYLSITSLPGTTFSLTPPPLFNNGAGIQSVGFVTETGPFNTFTTFAKHRKHTSERVVVVAKECWLGHAIAFQEPGITKALELWPSMKLPADTFYVWLQEYALI